MRVVPQRLSRRARSKLSMPMLGLCNRAFTTKLLLNITERERLSRFAATVPLVRVCAADPLLVDTEYHLLEPVPLPPRGRGFLPE